MKCPRTNTELKTVKVGKVPVYVSEECGGVFLENQTLKLFECPKDRRGEALAKHLSQYHNDTIDIDKRVSCPSCTDVVMLRRYYSPLHVVEIDECPGCGGIWLDTGELAKLQSLMLNEKDRAILRAELMAEHRVPKVEGMEHIRDTWIKRDEKIDALMDLASYITGPW